MQVRQIRPHRDLIAYVIELTFGLRGLLLMQWYQALLQCQGLLCVEKNGVKVIAESFLPA